MSEMLEKARKYEKVESAKIAKESRPAFHFSNPVGWMKSVLTGRTLPSEPSARHRYRIPNNVHRLLRRSCQHPGSSTVCAPQ